MTDSTTQQRPTPSKTNYTYFLIPAVLLLLFFVTVGWLLMRNNKSASENVNPTEVSGTFNINGVIPKGSTIVIERTDVTTGANKTVVAESLPATDGARWSFMNAVSGQTYTVTASLFSQGKTLLTSQPITITVPATQEVLTLNIPNANLTQQAMISGTIHVNGYIPQNATITISGRVLGQPTFEVVASQLQGAAKQFMSYSTATAGQTYEVLGSLLDASGNQIGSSSVLVVTAPALNETLTINSQAVPPVTPTPTMQPTPTASPRGVTPTPTPAPAKAAISGTIDFNGVAPANSRIVILQKIYNSPNYQVAVDNITPVNGAVWQWAGAKNATWYDLIAVLKQKQPNGTDKDIAGSASQSQAAPAAGISFTINSGINIGAPTGTITASCGNLSGSTWNGQLSYGTVGNGQTYWLQLGTSSGGNDTLSSIQAPINGANQTASINLNNGTTYYARYAYAIVANAGQAQFSPFSSVTQIRCGN